MRQLVYTVFINNNLASFYLWWKENLLNHLVEQSSFQNIMNMIADPFSQGIDAMQYVWSYQGNCVLYVFPPFPLIQVIFEKTGRRPALSMILIAASWRTQPWLDVSKDY